MIVHIDDDPEEDVTELAKHLLEENRELTNIKGFTLVHAAPKHVRTVPHKVADRFNNSPGAHIGRDARLVGELEIVKAKDLTKEVDNNPIKLFQDEGGDTHTAIVL